MEKSNRRVFMLQVIAGSAALAATQVHAASEDKVTEEDPYARSMGFRIDTNKVDKVKYKRHDAATQQCAKCQLYSGTPTGSGPCSFFGGREVPHTGWCRNFKAKPAA